MMMEEQKVHRCAKQGRHSPSLRHHHLCRRFQSWIDSDWEGGGLHMPLTHPPTFKVQDSDMQLTSELPQFNVGGLLQTDQNLALRWDCDADM